jgi:hypothetical protein
MRALFTLLVGLAWAAAALPQGAGKDRQAKRYGVEVDLKRYPQKTPQEALQSILKTFDGDRMYYLAAHLTDPKYVDERVKEHKRGLKGPKEAQELVAFEEVVKEIARHFKEDPALVRSLQQLGREGEWKVGADEASVGLKGIVRRAFFRRAEERWFLQNRQE